MQRRHKEGTPSQNVFRAKRYEVETAVRFRIRGEKAGAMELPGTSAHPDCFFGRIISSIPAPPSK